jgi:pyridoxal phosphate enzyme (YggS family)
MSVAENLARVREEIGTAAVRAGRSPTDVKLVAVSKTFPTESVVEAAQAGAHDVGENRVEEGTVKIPVANAILGAGKIHWHLIGHLQRRKARDAAALFDTIQSVDTFRLAETLQRHSAELGKQMSVLLQVNVADDPNKSGFSLDGRDAFFEDVGKVVNLPNLRVQGLMTIGPLVEAAEQARPFFRSLRILRDELEKRFPQTSWLELSMGMSDDFAVAIQEGATIVRIGRAIFGPREQTT